MFSLNKGDVYLPSTLPSSSGTVFWSVTKRNSPSQVLIKVQPFPVHAPTLRRVFEFTCAPTIADVRSHWCIQISNTASTAETLTFVMPTTFTTIATSGTAQVLTGAETASNSPTTGPNNVVPETSTIATGRTFNFTAPAFSVSVLTVDAS